MVIASLEESLFHLISQWYTSTGYLGIILAMALESCCIPLPSEIVMPLAGFFVATSAGTATGRLSLIGVTLAGALGCLLGSAVAYGIGASGGRPLLLRYGKYVLISQADSDRADRWFAKYGSPVAFFSRLLPVIRTYISLPAGISRMNFGKFMLYTFLGSLPWTFALAYLGYAFGPALQQKLSQMSNVFHGLDVIIIGLVVVAVAFYVYRHLKHDRQAAEAASQNGAHAPVQMPGRMQDMPEQYTGRMPDPAQGQAYGQGHGQGQGQWPNQAYGQPQSQPSQQSQWSNQPPSQAPSRAPQQQWPEQQWPGQMPGQTPGRMPGAGYDDVDQPTMPHRKL